MPATIIRGNRVAGEIRAELKEKVAKLKADTGVVPGLVMIRVGEDPASISYVTSKTQASEEIGVWSNTIVLPESASEAELLAKVEEMNNDPKVDGILVQLPLPKHIDTDKVLNAIDQVFSGVETDGQTVLDQANDEIQAILDEYWAGQ